jgi:hypothetical protein
MHDLAKLALPGAAFTQDEYGHIVFVRQTLDDPHDFLHGVALEHEIVAACNRRRQGTILFFGGKNRF